MHPLEKHMVFAHFGVSMELTSERKIIFKPLSSKKPGVDNTLLSRHALRPPWPLRRREERLGIRV